MGTAAKRQVPSAAKNLPATLHRLTCVCHTIKLAMLSDCSPTSEATFATAVETSCQAELPKKGHRSQKGGELRGWRGVGGRTELRVEHAEKRAFPPGGGRGGIHMQIDRRQPCAAANGGS